MAKSEKRKLIEKYIKDNDLPVTGLKYFGMINYYPNNSYIVESNSVVKSYDEYSNSEPEILYDVNRCRTPCWYSSIEVGSMKATIQFMVKDFGGYLDLDSEVLIRVGTDWCFDSYFEIDEIDILDIIKRNPFKPNPSIKIRPVE